MKVFKKQIGRLRSRIASRDSSPPHAQRFDVHNPQPSAIPSDRETLLTQAKDTCALTLETRPMDSDTLAEQVTDLVSLEPHFDSSSIPEPQPEASNVANFMEHVDPDLMKKFGRFRILIIGRATILQKICNSTEDPDIYNVPHQGPCTPLPWNDYTNYTITVRESFPAGTRLWASSTFSWLR